MGLFIDGPFPKTVSVTFPRLRESCDLVMDLEDGGLVLFAGKVPGKVQVGLRDAEVVVVCPDEDQMWWVRIASPRADVQAGKFTANICTVRVYDEVEFLTAEVQKALERFGVSQFPGLSATVGVAPCSDPTYRRVTLSVEGALPGFFPAKLGKKVKNLILGNLPQERDGNHPAVSLTVGHSLPDETGKVTVYVIGSVY